MLSKCSYHIVHYAGEGFFDSASGGGSGLWFWESSGRRGSRQRLTAYELAYLLRRSQTMLFYLSADLGAAVGDRHLLDNNDFLGVMDALVMAGVPYVFGYRWRITRNGAHRFAQKFYQALFETQSPARAALYARRELYIKDRTDATWASALLVSQPPPP